MSETLAFPMYDINHADTEALYRAVQQLLIAHGVAVTEQAPSFPGDELLAHWRNPGLVLSQTCGFPLVTALPEVQVVGCFHYTAPGCEGEFYRSLLVARAQDSAKTLADFRGQRVVCNAPDSQSGYNVLLKMVAPLAEQGRFFSGVTFSGSHRQSLIALRRGEGDIAAIDCVTWALLQRHEPELQAGLAVIGRSPLAPGLPLITAASTSSDTLRAIRAALTDLVSAPHYREICSALFIGGFSEATRQLWEVLLDWRRQAAEAGLHQL
ncbi:phosphate/phosphite/phosphonate ABC transporter substrate-binding protein [Leclercia sp. AS011]|uniref:phosphate/phosphite/phosphonate ABC transporter substrate-binding protein n=1 Tax=Leclercia sp. AS011 TaxID=3081257 RepID=UPI00301877A7